MNGYAPEKSPFHSQLLRVNGYAPEYVLTALIRNFYKTIMSRLDTKAFGLKKTSRIKAFVFRFISVSAKWIMTARRYVLNIYTENGAYVKPFKTEFG